MNTTITAVIIVSRRVGQTIFAVSDRTCRRNSPGLTLATLSNLPVNEINKATGIARPPELPLPSGVPPRNRPSPLRRKAAGVEGLEPPALGFGDRCSTS